MVDDKTYFNDGFAVRQSDVDKFEWMTYKQHIALELLRAGTIRCVATGFGYTKHVMIYDSSLANEIDGVAISREFANDYFGGKDVGEMIIGRETITRIAEKYGLIEYDNVHTDDCIDDFLQQYRKGW